MRERADERPASVERKNPVFAQQDKDSTRPAARALTYNHSRAVARALVANHSRAVAAGRA